MVDITVNMSTTHDGEQREALSSPLPFKKPTAKSLCENIFWTAYKFVFKASILNMIVARVTAAAAHTQSEAVSWVSLILSCFPLVAIVSIVCVQAEFTTREWVYYRMLEHHVIIDFPVRNSYSSLLNSAAALWIVGGTLLLAALMAYNASSGGISWRGWPYSEMSNVAMQAYLMISAVHEMRQTTKRLPNINTLILAPGNRDTTLAWIRQLEVMEEAKVQLHFLHVSEAAKAAASNRGSTSDVPQTSISECIDFAKVGKVGYTAESVDQLRSSGSAKGHDCVTALLMKMIVGSQWARLVPSNLYAVKADVQLVQQVRKYTICCTIASVLVMALGVASAGELGQKLMALLVGNDDEKVPPSAPPSALSVA